MIGKWKGWYKYDDLKLEFVNAAQYYGFVINIETLSDNLFVGSVKDDSAVSPMREIGKIQGSVNGNTIYFRKLMPVNYRLTLDGNYEQTNKPHPIIHYKGKINRIQMTARGRWYFKRKLALTFGFIPVLYRPGKGSWQMVFEVEN
jgi:hypothetical protein